MNKTKSIVSFIKKYKPNLMLILFLVMPFMIWYILNFYEILNPLNLFVGWGITACLFFLYIFLHPTKETEEKIEYEDEDKSLKTYLVECYRDHLRDDGTVYEKGYPVKVTAHTEQEARIKAMRKVPRTKRTALVNIDMDIGYEVNISDK